MDDRQLERMLDVKAVADLLGVSDRTIYRLAKAGKLGHKIGPQFWRFLPSDVMAFQRGEKPRSTATGKKG